MLKANLTYLKKHRVGDQSASTGIEEVADGQLIATTVNIDSKTERDRNAANIWAPVRTNSDVADFLLIVSTYKSKPKEE